MKHKNINRQKNSIFLSLIVVFSILISSFCLLCPTVVNAYDRSSFDLRDINAVTSVKNQGNGNTCWVFSAIGAIESSLIMNGYADTSIDLSEAHLGWFSINTAISNKDDLTYGDGYSASNPYQYGGNDLYVIWSIARGFGLELEEYAKYNEDNVNSTFVRENERYVSEFNVTEVNIFENTERENIKKALVSNGALMASYRDSSLHYNRGSEGYCFFENSYTSTNHATLIVGWDDNFSKNNFGPYKPTSDGAWLCRNTRGESWGDGGYFWMSYETTSLKRIVSFNAEPTVEDIYQIYQYDGYGYSKFLSLDDSGTVYNSNIYDVTENGSLEKIAFYTAMPDLNHEITIYKLNKGYTSPTDGTPVSTFNYKTNHIGYYLCDLPSPVEMEKNSSFSIVMKIQGVGRIHFYSEGTSDRTSVSGKSYASADGSSWLDVAENNLGNLCIKAWINPQVYEGPDLTTIHNLMSPTKLEYYEDEVLSSLMNQTENYIKNGGSEREILNNYLRLASLYEKYFGYVTIENEEQFLVFSEMVNNGNNFSETLVILTNDLDFTDMEFVAPNGFGGIFNGQHHTIKGISMTNDEGGLFGEVLSSGILKNINITESEFDVINYAGGIASRNSGLILDCSVNAKIKSKYMQCGGIAGFNEGTIQNCASKGKNSAGIAGNNVYGKVINCISESEFFVEIGNEAIDSYYAITENDLLIIKGEKIKINPILSYAKSNGIFETTDANMGYTGLKLGDNKVILPGDVDGDGMLSSSDYLRIKSHFLSRITLSDSELIASDIDRNGSVETTDYLLVKSHFLSLTNIYGV